MATASSAPAGKRPLGAIFLVLFIDLLGFSIIFPLFPAMLSYYLPAPGEGEGILAAFVDLLSSWASAGSADTSLMTAVLFGGILGSLYSLLQFIFAPIWGRLSDRIGRRTVLLYTISGNCLGYLLWIFSGNFWILLLSRVVTGSMAGNYSVATAAVADVTDAADRAKGMALVGIAFGLGFIIGPAIGGISTLYSLPGLSEGSQRIFALNPFSLPALIAFALSVINLGWALKGLPETLQQKQPRDIVRSRKVSTLFRIGNPAITRACWVNFLFLIAFSGMEFTLTFLAVERFSYRPFDNGMMFLYVGMAMILTQGVVVRRYAHRIGEKRLLTAGLLAGAVSLVLISFAESTFLFYAGLSVMALSAGLVNPCLMTLTSLYAPHERQGEMIGLFRSAGSLARIGGPLVAGILFFNLGSHYAYLIGAAVLITPFIASRSLPAAPPNP